MFENSKKLINRYKEIIIYIIFGVITTMVNWFVYSTIIFLTEIDMALCNVIAWFVSVLFAYVTNKVFVFKSNKWNLKILCNEVGLFFSARIVTGIIEIGGLPLLFHLGIKRAVFGIEGFVAKIFISIIVVILNYILSKLIVFHEKREYK